MVVSRAVRQICYRALQVALPTPISVVVSLNDVRRLRAANGERPPLVAQNRGHVGRCGHTRVERGCGVLDVVVERR